MLFVSNSICRWRPCNDPINEMYEYYTGKVTIYPQTTKYSKMKLRGLSSALVSGNA